MIAAAQAARLGGSVSAVPSRFADGASLIFGADGLGALIPPPLAGEGGALLRAGWGPIFAAAIAPPTRRPRLDAGVGTLPLLARYARRGRDGSKWLARQA